MPNSSRQFNNAVHALRALAVLMVFAVHLLDSFSTYFFPACEALNATMPFIKRFGTFGVELFFVISGFVIMNSVRKYGLREFLLRRLIRIYPLFAFFTVAFLVLSWITNVHSGSTVETALLNLTFLNIYFGTPALSPNAWSLTFEANFYIFAGVACFVLRERLIGVIILLLFGMTAFLITFPIATYFVVGCLLYAARELQPSFLPRSLQIAVLAACKRRTSNGFRFSERSAIRCILRILMHISHCECCSKGCRSAIWVLARLLRSISQP
jgi:peptidoglycan/LPS O-acetylase OafA/YrhL